MIEKLPRNKMRTCGNVVILLFIIPAENLEQQEMTTGNNEQKQRWKHEKVT